MKENKVLISFSTSILFVFTLLCIFVPIAKAADNGKIRITCVGDSITDGIGASSGQNTYPAQLQKILGDKYEVLNKGVSGTTVTNSDDRAYTKTSRYRESLTSQPDIVIILLGTNDITTKGINTDEGKKVLKMTMLNWLEIMKIVDHVQKLWLLLLFLVLMEITNMMEEMI